MYLAVTNVDVRVGGSAFGVRLSVHIGDNDVVFFVAVNACGNELNKVGERALVLLHALYGDHYFFALLWYSAQ